MITKWLDALEERLSNRVNSGPRRRRDAEHALTIERERKLARGEAMEAALNIVFRADFLNARDAAFKDLATRYGQDIINLAVSLSEIDFKNTPPAARFGKIKGPGLRVIGANAEWVSPEAVEISYGGHKIHFPIPGGGA